jgi:hypothetical protein
MRSDGPQYCRRLGPKQRARVLAQGGRVENAKWVLKKEKKTNSIYEAIESYLLLRGGWRSASAQRSTRRSRGARPNLQVGGWCATGLDFNALDMGQVKLSARAMEKAEAERKVGYSGYLAHQARGRAGNAKYKWWLQVRRNFTHPATGEWVRAHTVGATVPAANFYRGYELLCRKDEQVFTLRKAGIAHVAPDQFVYDPLSPEWSEASAFALAFGRHARKRHRRERWEKRELVELGATLRASTTPGRAAGSPGAFSLASLRSPLGVSPGAAPAASPGPPGDTLPASRSASSVGASPSARSGRIGAVPKLLGLAAEGGMVGGAGASPARGGGAGVLRAARNRRSAADIEVAKRKKRALVFARDEHRLDIAARKLETALLEGRLRSTWILKPAEGQCGDAIEIHDSLDAIFARLKAIRKRALVHEAELAELDHAAGRSPSARGASQGAFAAARAAGLSKAASAMLGRWVLQKYIERPLLLRGRRKFDMRAWVLVTADYDVLLYREGVLRTGSVPFSLDNLSDTFVHLTNHCIQEKVGSLVSFRSIAPPRARAPRCSLRYLRSLRRKKNSFFFEELFFLTAKKKEFFFPSLIAHCAIFDHPLSSPRAPRALRNDCAAHPRTARRLWRVARRADERALVDGIRPLSRRDARGGKRLLSQNSSPNPRNNGRVLRRGSGECSFIYRYIPRESCSQFDSLPLTSLTCFGAVQPQLGNHRRPPGSYVSFQVRGAAPRYRRRTSRARAPRATTAGSPPRRPLTPRRDALSRRPPCYLSLSLSAQLFGLDIMVDDAFKVHLIEINSSPAVAADLMPNFIEDLVHAAIDPLFPLERLGERDGYESGAEAAPCAGDDDGDDDPDWWLDATSARHFHAPNVARIAASSAARYATSEEAMASQAGSYATSPRRRAARSAAEERLAGCERGWDLVWRPPASPASEAAALAAAAARAQAALAGQRRAGSASGVRGRQRAGVRRGAPAPAHGRGSRTQTPPSFDR